MSALAHDDYTTREVPAPQPQTPAKGVNPGIIDEVATFYADLSLEAVPAVEALSKSVEGDLNLMNEVLAAPDIKTFLDRLNLLAWSLRAGNRHMPRNSLLSARYLDLAKASRLPQTEVSRAVEIFGRLNEYLVPADA